MARPPRNNVDYFPFICDEGNKMFYLEEIYGNDGFATFIKILRELGKTNFHYLDLSKNTTQMFLSAKCKVSRDILNSIICDLVDLEKFDKVLWNENKIIWCQDFIDSIQDAYSKRKNKCITYEGLLLRLISLGIRKQSKSPLKGVINPQSIVENTIENKIKEESNENALTFLKNSEFDFDLFEMQNKKNVKEWDLMLENFNYKVDQEDLEFTIKKIKARLMQWMGNWIRNENKSKNTFLNGNKKRTVAIN